MLYQGVGDAMDASKDSFKVPGRAAGGTARSGRGSALRSALLGSRFSCAQPRDGKRGGVSAAGLRGFGGGRCGARGEVLRMWGA